MQAVGGGHGSPGARGVDAAERPPSLRETQLRVRAICRVSDAGCDRTAVAIVGDGAEKWGRHGCPRASTGRCSCVTNARSPARPMLRAVLGVTQVSPSVPTIAAAAVASCVPARIRGARPRGWASRGTIARRRTRPSVCCPTASPVIFPVSSRRWSPSWTVEAVRSDEAAADVLRPDITLPAAVRWI